jgi:lipoyl-dependent peroxiredoxin
MAIRKAQAVWEGSLKEGSGTMKFSTYEGPFTWASRFEEAAGTNPEELLGAAHAGCFSMSLSSGLTREGFAPNRITTTASVNLGRVDGKARILSIELESEAQVPGISNEMFLEIAEAAKSGCPVSVALSGVEITLLARLIQ